MKALRHKKILEIIGEKTITTQEELQKHLEEEGFSTTQATISRDIKDLRLIKALSSNGSYYYTTAHSKIDSALEFNLSTIFMESIKSVDYAGYMVSIKCYSGLANAVCASIDNGSWDGLVGTIAGDDTIFLLLKSEPQAKEFCEYITNVLHGLVK